MNIKTQVLLIFIIIVLLVIGVNIYYSGYQRFSPVESTNEVNIDSNNLISESTNEVKINIISEMSRIMNLQGIQCEELSYTKRYKIELKRYWKLINDYRVFHEDGVRKLNSEKSSDVRTLTWHCTDTYDCGGLGHRVNGITAFLLLAIASKRVLLLKWDKTSVEKTYLLPNMIDWRYPDHSLKGSFEDLGRFFLRGDEKNPMTMIEPLAGDTNHLAMLFNRLGSMNKFIKQLSKKQNNSLSKPVDLHLFQVVSFMSLFKFSEELRSFADMIRKKLNPHRERYVALHIRTGQIEHIGRGRFISANNDTKSAVECAIRQADKHIGPDSIIVVISDSGSLKQKLANEYPRVKVLNNTIAHSDKAKNLNSNDMLGTWQDIIIMAEAYILVYHMSAFPEMSIAMCGLPKERIVDFEYCQ